MSGLADGSTNRGGGGKDGGWVGLERESGSREKGFGWREGVYQKKSLINFIILRGVFSKIIFKNL